ncbi:putative enoyl-CoA hydratase/isomerase YngF [Capsicum baccatum]|uniref:Enoyl-CoA hydratase/isomerase YngF n=1 Tax=Capsicum baccatum TaxID=33114 RepID=A0A2G2W7X0_CAPBA|nr:putative enoyl-CoA hydratase/isomerase YngF [Capsicum baccatum]
MSAEVVEFEEQKTMIPSEVLDFVSTLRSTFSFLEALHIPTIVVIEGITLGGGLEMAMSCDIRICEDAVLGLPETGLAIIPGYASITHYMFAYTESPLGIEFGCSKSPY